MILNQFEYKIISTKKRLTEWDLNNLGLDEWELCAIDSEEYIFKRQRKMR